MVKTGLTASHFTIATTHYQRLNFTKMLFNYKELVSREGSIASRIGNIHEPSICKVRSFTETVVHEETLNIKYLMFTKFLIVNNLLKIHE